MKSNVAGVDVDGEDDSQRRCFAMLLVCSPKLEHMRRTLVQPQSRILKSVTEEKGG